MREGERERKREKKRRKRREKKKRKREKEKKKKRKKRTIIKSHCAVLNSSSLTNRAMRGVLLFESCPMTSITNFDFFCFERDYFLAGRKEMWG